MHSYMTRETIVTFNHTRRCIQVNCLEVLGYIKPIRMWSVHRISY